MKKKIIPHLGIIYSNQVEDSIIDSQINNFKDEDIIIHKEKTDDMVFAAMEWAIPTLIAAYILHPYFSAFFSELGKDHYQKLKTGLKKLTMLLKDDKSTFVAAKESPHKLSPNYDQSILLSMIFQTRDNKQIKLLFNKNLSDADRENAIDKILSLLVEHYIMFPNDLISKEFTGHEIKKGDPLYVFVHETSKELTFYSNYELIKIYKNNE